MTVHACTKCSLNAMKMNLFPPIFPNDFISYQLLKLLFHSSDMTVRLGDGSSIHCHKFVLSIRNSSWITEDSTLDWTDLDPKVAHTIAKWVYTNKVNPKGHVFRLTTGFFDAFPAPRVPKSADFLSFHLEF